MTSMRARLPAPLRTALREVRTLGRLPTSGRRALPGFMVIGTMKGGTTSLFSDLMHLPGLRRPLMKEPQWFVGRNSHRSWAWYRTQFPHRGMTGEATTYLLAHPHAPLRVAERLPGVRFIVLLRDPAARARSHWAHQVRMGRETLPFAEALAAEDGRVSDAEALLARGELRESSVFQHFAYRRYGYYAEQLQRWYEHFPAEQILVLESEEYFERPDAVVAQVARFLGVPAAQVPHEVRNRGAYPGGRRDGGDTEALVGLHEHYRAHAARLEAVAGRSFRWTAP